MSQFWSDTTRRLQPYVPGEQPKVPNLIKLNTNEHPLPPSSRATAAIAAVSPDDLRRYPDPASSQLCTVIAAREGLKPTQVFVGNGSDEVLAHVFQALMGAATEFSAPDITYSFYPVWANLYGLSLREVPLLPNFAVDVEALASCPGAILLANPNAPTGIALDIGAIETLVSSCSSRLVVIDEAYFGFGAQTAASLLSSYDNLLITRSLSKSHALAGLRVGYALGSEALIEGLVRVKDSFNSYPLDALAQAGAVAAMNDTDWFGWASEQVIKSRTWLHNELEALGFSVLPSAANFIFVRHKQQSGKDIFDALRSKDILVRRWDKPRIADHLRISIGTEQQCERLVEALADIL